MSKKCKIVIVEWVDSMGSSGWHDYTETNMDCVSAGHLIAVKKDRVVIAMNKSMHNSTYGDYMEIPKAAIKKISRIRKGDS